MVMKKESFIDPRINLFSKNIMSYPYVCIFFRTHMLYKIPLKSASIVFT